MDTAEWVIVDTETDGLYSPIQVVEVAAQHMQGASSIGEPFHTFINHNVAIPPEALAIHGYTQAFLRQHGVPPKEAYTQLRSYIGDNPVCSHYLNFDWDRTLLPEWHRLDIPPIGQKGMCTWRLSRRVIHETSSHKLDCLRDHFSLCSSRPHSALGDVESIVDLFTRILFPRLSQAGFSTYDKMHEFSCANPIERCRCLIQGKDYEEEVRKAKDDECRIERMLQILNDYDFAQIHQLVVENNIIPEHPEVQFENRVFLFTGKMLWGPRSRAQALVLKLGGQLAKSKALSSHVDYLILGEDPERGWTRVLGGKVRDGIGRKITHPNSKLQLVLETDFIAALNMIKEGV